jgi:hypothetical protein
MAPDPENGLILEIMVQILTHPAFLFTTGIKSRSCAKLEWVVRRTVELPVEHEGAQKPYNEETHRPSQ